MTWSMSDLSKRDLESIPWSGTLYLTQHSMIHSRLWCLQVFTTYSYGTIGYTSQTKDTQVI